jgi:hypothetical protein
MQCFDQRQLSRTGFISAGHEYTPPNHCYNCGAPPFPWKTAKVEADKEPACPRKGRFVDDARHVSISSIFPSKNYVYKPFRALEIGNDCRAEFASGAVNATAQLEHEPQHRVVALEQL